MGLLIFIFAFIQIGSGVYIDKTFDPKRTSIPIRDKLHWWNGRILMILSWINVPLGMYLFNDSWYAFSPFYYVGLAAWILLLFITFYEFKRLADMKAPAKVHNDIEVALFSESINKSRKLTKTQSDRMLNLRDSLKAVFFK